LKRRQKEERIRGSRMRWMEQLRIRWKQDKQGASFEKKTKRRENKREQNEVEGTAEDKMEAR
jgi:hypothetical protein